MERTERLERQVPTRSGVHGRFDGAEANRDQEVHRAKWQLQKIFRVSETE